MNAAGRTTLRTSLARAAVVVVAAAPVACGRRHPPRSAATTTELATQVVTLVNAERQKVGCAAGAGQPGADHRRQGAQRRHGEVQLLQPHLTRRPFAMAADARRQVLVRVGREHRCRPDHREWCVRLDAQHGPPQEHPQLLEQGHGVGVARGGSYGIYWTQDFGTR